VLLRCSYGFHHYLGAEEEMKTWKFLFGLQGACVGIACGVYALIVPHPVAEQIFYIVMYTLLLVGGLYMMSEGLRD